MRIKELKGGNRSIYLDTYLNGKHQYEFLKMYLVPEVDETAKTLNANTLQAANAIKAQRLLELTQERGGISKSGHRENMPLFDWIEEFRDRAIKRGVRTTEYIDCTIALLTKFGCKDLLMKDIDKPFCLNFLRYVKGEYRNRYGRPLKPITQLNYIHYMNNILNEAVRAEVIAENPFNKIDGEGKMRVPESPREFLTIDEVKRLIDTPCGRDDVKMAYLFSCYCGLRIGDIETLKWGDIIRDGEQYRIQIVMQKTREACELFLANHRAYARMVRQNQNREARLSSLERDLSELRSASIQPGESDELLAKRKQLAEDEKRYNALNGIRENISGEMEGISCLQRLREASERMKSIAVSDEKMRDISVRCESIYFEL